MVTLTRRLPPFASPPGQGRPDRSARRGGASQRMRAAWRGSLAALFTLPSVVVQSALIALPGRGKIRFARFYWATLCRVMGLRLRVIGTQARRAEGRAVVFASNHSSWLDILALGGTLEACFIAKDEVSRWPVIRTIARLGRTVFVSRRAANTGRERDSMRARLEGGDNLILFPEGTSSDGSRVLPFRSAFFSIVEPGGEGRPPLIQPVSIVYDRLDGLPIGRAKRPVCAWYGDMDLGSHFWRLARYRGVRATIVLHDPIDPAEYPSRKDLAQACWQVVADGAAVLRQNRPAAARPSQPSGPHQAAFA